MAFVRSDGADIWYNVQGDGQPLTLVGGDIMASNQFDFAFPFLVREATVVTWDFCGIGASERPEGMNYNLDRKVDDMCAVLDAAGIERTHIWAAATGTLTSVRFAAKYPDRVASIVHYGQIVPTDGGQRIYRILKMVMDEYDWPDACRHMVNLYAPDPMYRDWTEAIYVKNAVASVFQAYYEEELTTDLTAEFADLEMPNMVLIGGRGPLGAHTSYGSGWRTAMQVNPRTQVEIIEQGTGTYFMVDAAQASSAQVLAFMQSAS
jgi:pimeloyl-ACP methyl ester carboxylesterase